jgi:glycosyltransferase involved in cell wall biosynthesis
MSVALARRGHRVVLGCYHHGDAPDPEGITVVRAPPLPGAAVNRSGLHWSKPAQNLLLARTVRKILREFHPDIIHAHNVEAPLVVRMARLRTRVPVIYNAHTRMGVELCTYVPGWLSKPAGWLGGAVDAVMPFVSQAALAISEDGGAHLGSRWGAAKALIPPGVDLEELTGADPARARAAWGLDGRPWVVYAGNGDRYQDLPVLFEALGRAPELGLLVVTGSPLEPLRKLAAKHSISAERLRLVQSTAFRDTLDALAVGSVAGLPRTQCAGFPIKLLNQLALGLPTVAAEGSAAPIPGVLTVPNGDPSTMAATLRRVAMNPGLRAALSQQARDAIAAEWTWERRAVQLESFYEQVLRI